MLVSYIFKNVGLLSLAKNIYYILQSIISIIKRDSINSDNNLQIKFCSYVIDSYDHFPNKKKLDHILYNKGNWANNGANKHKNARKNREASRHKRTSKCKGASKYKRANNHLLQ